MGANQCFFLHAGSAYHNVGILIFRKKPGRSFYWAECNTGSGWWRGGTRNQENRIVPHIYRLKNYPTKNSPLSSTNLRGVICWMMLGILNPRYDQSEQGYPGHWLGRCHDLVERAERFDDLGLAAQSAANPFQRGGSCAVRSVVAAIRLMFALDCRPMLISLPAGG